MKVIDLHSKQISCGPKIQLSSPPQRSPSNTSSPKPCLPAVVNCFDSLHDCIRNLFPYQYLKRDIIVFNGCCVWICHNSFKQVLVFHSNEQSGNEHPGAYIFAPLTHYFLRMNSQKWNCWVTRAPHWKTPDTIVQMWEDSNSKGIEATLCPVSYTQLPHLSHTPSSKGIHRGHLWILIQ